MPIESIQGFRAAKQEAIKASNTSTYRDKYVHIEWIDQNFYQLNIHDTYLGDGNSDIVDCYRDGVQVLSHDDMIAQMDMDDLIREDLDHQEDDFNGDLYWSDDDAE